MDIWSNEIKVMVVDDKQQEHLIALKNSYASSSGSESRYVFCNEEKHFDDYCCEDEEDCYEDEEDEEDEEDDCEEEEDCNNYYKIVDLFEKVERHVYRECGIDKFSNERYFSRDDCLIKFDKEELYDTLYDNYDDCFTNYADNGNYNFNSKGHELSKDDIIQNMSMDKMVDVITNIANGKSDINNEGEKIITYQIKGYLKKNGIKNIEKIVKVVSVGGYKSGMEDFEYSILRWHDYRGESDYDLVAKKYHTDIESLKNYEQMLEESLFQGDIIIRKEYNPKDMTVCTTNKVTDEELICSD